MTPAEALALAIEALGELDGGRALRTQWPYCTVAKLGGGEKLREARYLLVLIERHGYEREVEL